MSIDFIIFFKFNKKNDIIIFKANFKKYLLLKIPMELPVCAYTSFIHHTLKSFQKYSYDLQELEDSTEEMNYFGSNLLSYLALQIKIQIQEKYLLLFKKEFLHDVDVDDLYINGGFSNRRSYKDPKNDPRFYQGELCPLNYRGPCDHCGESYSFSSFTVEKDIKIRFLIDPKSNKKFKCYIKEGTELRRWANYCSGTCAGVTFGCTDRTATHYRCSKMEYIFSDANLKLDKLCEINRIL